MPEETLEPNGSPEDTINLPAEKSQPVSEATLAEATVAAKAALENVTPIGGYDLVTDREEAIVFCAMLCHEVNRVYANSMNEQPLQVSWAETAQWQRDSMISGVQNVLLNPSLTPKDSHENWMAMKLKEGWVYGPVKDVEKKTHPCLLPFDALSAFQRTKDVFFINTVKAFFGL